MFKMNLLRRITSRLFARLMKSWSWVLLIMLAILIKWASWYPLWVEENYTYGIYRYIALTQRFLFGWVPFSIGDIFYAFLLLIIVYKTAQFIRALVRRRVTRSYLVAGLQQIIFFFLLIYVLFNLLWGLNYNRRGVASQLQMVVQPYSTGELDSLVAVLQERLNEYAAKTDEAQRKKLNKKKTLFSESAKAYQYASAKYPFLYYSIPSVKPSLFSYAGNYLGFQGYYNPFSGEAQVNTTIPSFLEPFVTAHEIAHQLGYGKENEANFVAFLACKEYPSDAFRYSLYFDMFNYAFSEAARRDTAKARRVSGQLHPQVKQDIAAYRRFLQMHKNPVEQVVMWGYGHYLKANNQPAGKNTYNEVVAWLIAYHKKFGKEAM